MRRVLRGPEGSLALESTTRRADRAFGIIFPEPAEPAVRMPLLDKRIPVEFGTVFPESALRAAGWVELHPKCRATHCSPECEMSEATGKLTRIADQTSGEECR